MAHANDMTHWDVICCQRGCTEHPTRVVPVHLGGPTKYRDLPPIPYRFSMDFDFEVWDTDQTPVDGGPYCPARDAVSETILSHGVWEPTETIVMLDVFRRLPNLSGFIDIGAQLGWFSVLAAESGMSVYAVEADPDVASVLDRNLQNRPTIPVVSQHRIANDSLLGLEAVGDPHVAVKIDVEGAEPEAVAALAGILHCVDYMMIEVTPVFDADYTDMIYRLFDAGFIAGLLPHKARPAPRLDSLLDLEWIKEPFAPAWHQENVLFAREDLV